MESEGPPPTAPPASPAEGGPRRRRRRRGRGGRGPAAPPGLERSGEHAPSRAGDATAPPRPAAGGRPDETRRNRRRARDRDRRGPEPPAAPVVPTVSHLAEATVVQEPLRADEVEEMKEHLAFIREYKEVLRLRLNAAEDLLVNGRREPSDRGVCRHLLGKIDRSVIEAAIGREPLKSTVAARSRMLAGAIRLTADVGVLLAYLETLAPQRSHAEAAEAFAEVVRRIDFESLSATRLARLLQVLTETFAGQERVQVLFSLLDGDAFRRAFDAAESSLPSEVAAVFAPLRAVHRRFRGEPLPPSLADDAGLAVGLEQVMAAPDPVLRGYAEPLRVRMLELALDPGIPAVLADRAAGVLLTSLARTGKTFTRLALRRAAQLLARHVDDRARATLEEVTRIAPGYHVAERWLGALGARRMGRVALLAAPPERGRLMAGFWLDAQRAVWLRTAAATDAARLASEAELQEALALPGVAPVVEHGIASGIPYVATLAAGQPWRLAGLDRSTALALAAQAARILRALSLADVALPDAEPERFCVGTERTPTLVLVDLDGAHATSRAAAETTNATAGVALVRRLLPDLEAPDGLAALVRGLDHALLLTRRD